MQIVNTNDRSVAQDDTATRRTALKIGGSAIVAPLLATTPTAAQQESSAPHQRLTLNTGEPVSSPTVDDGTVFVGSDNEYLYAVDVESGEQEWAYKTGGEVATPTVADGTVYVAGGDALYAVDAERGEQEWVFPSSVSRQYRSKPTVVDGTVFVSSGYNMIYAVDAESGEEKWGAETTPSTIYSSPTVVDGTLFVGAGNGLYAIGTETGLLGNAGEQLWEFETGDIVYSSPTVVDGTVFVGSSDNYLYAVDAESGDERWAFEANSAIYSSPTVAHGTVFVGSGSQFADDDDDDDGNVNYDDNLYAIDAETGDEQWTFDAGYFVESSPTVADGTVFVGSDDKRLYAIDAESGDKKWAFETGDEVHSSPVVADGTVFVGSDDGHLYALDAGVSGSSEGSRVTGPLETEDNGSSALGPGFGVPSGIAALGGAGYLIKRRLTKQNSK